MSGHTAGPWIQVEGSHSEVEITTQARIDAHQGEICAMDIYFGGQHGIEQPANAALIAAAPELAESLAETGLTADEAIADTLEQIHNGECGTGPGLVFLANDLRARTKKRRAAIAKASQ